MDKDASSTQSLLECYLRRLECFAQGSGDVSWKEVRESNIQALRSLAHDFPVRRDSVIHQLNDQDLEYTTGGDEHKLANLPGNDQGTVVYKVTYGDNFGCSVQHDPLDEDYTGVNFCARGNDNPWFYLRRW